MSRKHKIILLGSDDFCYLSDASVIDCYAWDKVEKIKNIKDYDSVIFNLLPFDDNFPPEIFLKLRKVIDVMSFFEIVKNSGIVIILGDPRFNIKYKSKIFGKEKETQSPFLYWTGIDFYWDSQPGDTIVPCEMYKHEEFTEYVKYFRRWEYSLSHHAVNSDLVGEVFNLKKLREMNVKISTEIDTICLNRIKNPLIFSIRSGLFSLENNYDKKLYGPLIFLPKIEIDPEKTLKLIFKNFFGIEFSKNEPSYLNSIIVPGQEVIEAKISDLQKQNESIDNELEMLKQEKGNIRMPIKLLYEEDKILEEVVKEILRKLGASIKEPDEPNKEEGWISYEKFNGVLEIKSTKNDYFSEDGIRQLYEWHARGIIKDKVEYKKIFIGNAGSQKRIEQRIWPFSNSWKQSAQLGKVCAIRTQDLFEVYVCKLEGKLNIKKFWSAVFTTDGILEINNLLSKDY